VGFDPGLTQPHLRTTPSNVLQEGQGPKFIAGETGTKTLYEHVLANNGSDGRNRTILFFFAGGVAENELAISGGARQAVAKVRWSLHGSYMVAAW
jgi:hypothetical protein